MESNTSFEFVHPTHSLLQRMQSYRLRDELTDVTIKAGKKKEFRAHKIVLLDSSPVLNAWLSDNWQANNTLEFHQEVIDSSIVADLLDYFYLGKITLTDENVHAICRASQFLIIPELLSASEGFLNGRIATSNVFEHFFFSDELGLEVIRENCVGFILENYEIVVKDLKLKNLSEENFRLLVKSIEEKPERRHKKAWFELLLAWVEFDSTERSTSLPSLLAAFPLHELCDKAVASHSLIRDSSSCSKIVMDARNEISSSHPESSKPAKGLYCFGGIDKYYNTLSSISRLNISTKQWARSSPMPTAKAHHCGALIGDKIYLLGGYSGDFKKIFNTMQVFNYKTNTWKKLRFMPQTLMACAAAALDGHIYVSGGSDYKNEETSTSVFRYTIESNEWQQVKAMNVEREGHQLVQLNGRLYAIGGHDLSSVEEYNPRTDEWRMVANMEHTHFKFGATSHNGKIYVCSDKGFEMYCPDCNAWNTLKQPNDSLGRTLVSVNGKLWAMGGEKADKAMFEFDTSTGKWKQLPDMDIPRSHHCSFVVHQ